MPRADACWPVRGSTIIDNNSNHHIADKKCSVGCQLVLCSLPPATFIFVTFLYCYYLIATL